jgi:oligopeptide transport system substrate-binding protein
VGVRALDDVTLVVKLVAPASYFLHLVAQNVTYPVPRPVIAAYGEKWTAAEYIVTNGPFRLESWNWGQAAVLTRNPTYHGRFTGNVERIELNLSPWDNSANLRQYEADHIDLFFASFSSPEMEGLRQQYGGEYVSLPWQQTSYIGFDAGRPPFDDVRVRRAFALAIDRTRLANLVPGGATPAMGGFIPTGLPGHSPGISLPYDPEQARQLLAEAGYPGGQDFPHVDWLVLTWQPLAEYLQRQWNENLGLELAPGEIVHMANFADRFQQESPPLFLGGWVADYPDPDSFLRVGILESDQQASGWKNEAYTTLVEKARLVSEQKARLNLYRQADKILVEEAALIPLTYGRGHLLRKPWVKRYPTSPAKWWFWKDVIIEPPPG